MSRPTWILRESDVPGYSPANHSGTVNRRLISPETVGAKHLEVLVGTIEKGQGALPHAHPGIEQVCYLLEGTADVEMDGERGSMVAGDCCFFPADRSEEHTSELQSRENLVCRLLLEKKKHRYDSC